MKSEKNFIKIDKRDTTLGYVLFMTWVGSLVYFVQNSEGVGGFFVAIFQSIIWPAIVSFRALELLGL